ncbi:hypothetical protein GOP47_0002407 [Adiantum capillus-veneris]|uniref:Uncharacterized protein n=1 Tax=Adiantum capillus-veneris TaxID=13818 RepID=A0A9D4VAB2_ADICA|nr:hypothetical protein GOP47_0002407 [Adiantum capillus-veneris]
MWMSMLVDSSSSFYQVILTSPHLQGYLQVYDSRICIWKVLGAPDSSLFVYDPRSQSWDQDKGHRLKTMATVHHVYNVLDDDLFVRDRQRGALYTYNADRCMWSTVKTAVPSCLGRLNLALECVVKCKGRILLVGCLELADNYRRRAEGLGVWECKLDVSQGSPTATWVELATTPHHLWEPYRGTRPVDRWCQIRCYVAPENRIIVMGVEFAAEVALNKFWPPLAHDVDCGSWEPLPSCGGGTDYISYFVFQPSWNAVP